MATTNNPHPLTDATGSRRYICLTIPEGQFIDNAGNIDYDQLYAQVLEVICKEYPSVKINHNTKVHLGFAMKELGFEHSKTGNVAFYKVVPLKAA